MRRANLINLGIASLAVGLCMVLTASVSANTFTETFPVSSTAAMDAQAESGQPSSTDWTQNLTFNQFNPSATPGTLVKVEFDLTLNGQTIITLTNNSDVYSQAYAAQNFPVYLGNGGSISSWLPKTLAIYNSNPDMFDLSSENGGQGMAPGEQTTSGNITYSQTGAMVDTTAGDMANFTGSSTMTLPAWTKVQDAAFYTGGNASAIGVTEGQVSGTVTYTYNSVPEPASLSLIGLAGFAVLARRRRMA